MQGKEVLGVIGGTGLYEIPGIEIVAERRIDTPFGSPSDAYVLGRLHGQDVVFLSRHGRGHKIPPHAINYRANIYGLKALGVTQVLAVSAVGSMKEEIEPGHMVIVDQFFDRTKSRVSTFFDAGLVAHVSFADPVCPRLSNLLSQAARSTGATVHQGGTYLCIEGPHFSTRAESRIYRSWGVDVIGMTNVTEAKLAREAQLCFATLALATDYDCWHQSEADVDVEAVMAVMAQNAKRAADTVARLCRDLASSPRDCACGTSLEGAILTAEQARDPALLERLALLLEGSVRGQG